MTDPIADMLTRIRNAAMIRKQDVVIPSSNVKIEIAKILEREGFIKGWEQVKPDAELNQVQPQIKVELKYKEKQSVIRSIARVSKPGRRVYHGYRDIHKVIPSLGIQIVSTPQGLMTNVEARTNKLGGEIICEIY